MTINEIHTVLLKEVRRHYDKTEIIHLDIPLGEVEFKFNLDHEDRMRILEFMSENPEIFSEANDDTARDILEMDNICIRFDEEGTYFGRSSYDYTACSAAAFFILDGYLNSFPDRIEQMMENYREGYSLN